MLYSNGQIQALLLYLPSSIWASLMEVVSNLLTMDPTVSCLELHIQVTRHLMVKGIPSSSNLQPILMGLRTVTTRMLRSKTGYCKCSSQMYTDTEIYHKQCMR